MAAIHYDTSSETGAVFCGATDVRGLGPTRGYRTTNLDNVTCKRCLRSLATHSLDRYLEELAKTNQFSVAVSIPGCGTYTSTVYAVDESDAQAHVRRFLSATDGFEITVERVKGGAL